MYECLVKRWIRKIGLRWMILWKVEEGMPYPLEERLRRLGFGEGGVRGVDTMIWVKRHIANLLSASKGLESKVKIADRI